METKIIIVCAVLVIATVMLGLFRLWWLRKCYDKARAEKKNVLEREQMALADKLFKNYDEARAATWKCIGIVSVVIVILGGAFWGIVRIAQAHDAEKEQVKVEKMEETSDKGFFYYFSYEGNLERFTEHRKEVYDKILFSIQETKEKIQKAKASGDKSGEVLLEALLKKLNDDFDKAKEKTERDLLDFNEDREKIIFLHLLGAVVLVLLSLGIVFANSYGKSFFITSSFTLSAVGGISSIFVEWVSWAVPIFGIVVIINIFLVCKNWKKADWDWED